MPTVYIVLETQDDEMCEATKHSKTRSAVELYGLSKILLIVPVRDERRRFAVPQETNWNPRKHLAIVGT
jgi:hypothetical protein